MTTPRLRTQIWVQACVRRGNIDSIALTVVHKGDPSSGAILIKLNPLNGSCVVLAETRDAAGDRAWFRGTGPSPLPEAEADAYIARHRARDPDLWVIEIEDRSGRLPFDEKILEI